MGNSAVSQHAPHFRRAKLAYEAYCRQTGGKSLATGDTLPPFEVLREPIKEAWNTAAMALALDSDQAIVQERKSMRRAVRLNAAFDLRNALLENEIGQLVDVVECLLKATAEDPVEDLTVARRYALDVLQNIMGPAEQSDDEGGEPALEAQEGSGSHA